MPTYDYVCEACNHEFELFQSIKEGAKRKCPECGRQKLRRLIGPGAAIVFKGSGFYATDYARGSSGRPSAPKASSKKGTDGTPSKGDTAPSKGDKSSD